MRAAHDPPRKNHASIFNAAKDFFRVVSGKILSVFGPGNKTLHTSTATIGIRGTGCYIEAEEKSVYFFFAMALRISRQYACLMPYDHDKATLGPNVYLINFNERILTNEYGLLCLMSLGVQEQLKLASTSTAQPKLNKENVKVCAIVIPPTLAEQAAILSCVSARSQEFGDLINEAQRAIDLLQECRTALISAAVTGQIDVWVWCRYYVFNSCKRLFRMRYRPIFHLIKS